MFSRLDSTHSTQNDRKGFQRCVRTIGCTTAGFGIKRGHSSI